MTQSTIQNISIRGVHCVIPGEPLDVMSLPRSFSESDARELASGIGLEHLHRVAPGTTTGDLCVAAASPLLQDLGWEPSSVDAVIQVTQTPDHFLPSTACIAHRRLALDAHCLAFDIGMGCSGYVYGLFVAASLIAAGGCKRVLLLAGDTVSRIISEQDKSVALLFGDAGTATAIEFDSSAAPISFVLGSDGTGAGSLVVPAGGFRERPSATTRIRVEASDGNARSPEELFMDGVDVFSFTLKRVPALIKAVLEKSGWIGDTVDWYLFHQANKFILQSLAKKLKIDPVKLPLNIQKFGNTSVASIPLLIGDCLGEGLLRKEPARCVMAGFGVGYSWAAAAVSLAEMKVARVSKLPF